MKIDQPACNIVDRLIKQLACNDQAMFILHNLFEINLLALQNTTVI